nr:F-box protein At5g49610-like [Ipomoea batatas]
MIPDVLFEILTRTTLETMDTCKVVSTELKELINDPWFKQTYSQKTRNIFGYFVQTVKGNRHLSKFVPINPTLNVQNNISIQCFKDDLKILASCSQGILCCRKYENRSYQYYVCKPSTSQLVALPSPRKPGQLFERVALTVLKSKPYHYQIVRFSDDHYSSSGQDSYICEVFDSKLWTWRQSKNLVTEQSTIFGHQPSVCIGGIVNWLTNKNSVLAFDSTTETHSEFPTPTAELSNDGGYEKKRIVKYNGKLGFSCEYKSEKLLLWELEDRRNCKWKIKKVVGIDKDEKRLIGCSLADMALMTGYRLQVYEQSGLHFPMDIFPFRSDWAPVNLKGDEMTGF